MYKITNTSLDYTKNLLHRRAARMQMEPTIAGQRLRLRSSILLTEKQVKDNEVLLKLLETQGTVSVSKVSSVEAEVVLSDTVVVIEDEGAPQIEVEKPVVVEVEKPVPVVVTA